MSFSTLFKLRSDQINTEAEVETRLLARLFHDLGYEDDYIIPKKQLKPLMVNEGSKSVRVEADFLLLDKNKNGSVLVEAKDPSKSVQAAWGQTASYALSYNKDKPADKRVKWLLISNGYVTSLYTNDSSTPIVSLRLSDFASGIPPYVTLRSFIKFDVAPTTKIRTLAFKVIPPDKLNQLFAASHDLVWKKEKLAPTDAFFEFCKFIFIKIREDKKRELLPDTTPSHLIPLTTEWLDAQMLTTTHPVRDIMFKRLRDELEDAIKKDKKKRIFAVDETLQLSASTCSELIKAFQSINLSSIDEDLNGRMFEVFLTAAIRGKALGQFFTPRPVVDFMTRIALRNADVKEPPLVLDACCGTAGFLIEVMAYLTATLRGDTRFSSDEHLKIKNYICNECLYGVEANERVARIARINMYLHGDGGSHIFHSDGLDIDPQVAGDKNQEQRDETNEHKEKITQGKFNIVLTNPPFSMNYSTSNVDEKRIIKQHSLTASMSSVKSSILFLNRYYELLKLGGEMLIVLDDTVLNGISNIEIRQWLVDNFIILGVHSLPFNAFFKAKANIKTSILHLRKKIDSAEMQSYVFMSISNNIGHDNSEKDTPQRNNLTETLIAYLEWQRTGFLENTTKFNNDAHENLECPQQYFLVSPDDLSTERFDAFFYCPDLKDLYAQIEQQQKAGLIDVLNAKDLTLRKKITRDQKKDLLSEGKRLKYIEIGDVTQYGLITKYIEDTIDELPSRGEYQIKKGDILLALNNSSRGTVVLVPDEFDDAICTSGFFVIVPGSMEEGYLLWYSLRSEACRKQIYYLAQTASQPELKLTSWNTYFKIPLPLGKEREIAVEKAIEFYSHLAKLLSIQDYTFSLKS